VIPARNEEAAIGPLLDSLDAQTYDHALLEVVIADGGSTDATRCTVKTWDDGHHLRVRVIDNEQRVTASGMNAGILATEAEIVIVLGAHAAVPADFVESSVRVLTESGADCAGGLLETIGTTVMGEAIAAATTSPFGVGNALFRTGAVAPRDVDTVAFGAYRRELFDRIGGFDVSLVGAEDDELNFRLGRSGGRIRFDPSIRATYYCRTSLRGLAQQYFMYGRGKAWVLKKHRRLPSVRMLAPAALVVGVASGVVAAVALQQPVVVLVVLVPYGAVIALGASRAAKSSRASRPRIALALVTLHVAYGVGLFAGAIRRAPRPSQSANSSS
jgi:GT2 family glycosyltransferase